MVKIFTACSDRMILKFNKLLEGKGSDGPNSIELDLEAEFSSLALILFCLVCSTLTLVLSPKNLQLLRQSMALFLKLNIDPLSTFHIGKFLKFKGCKSFAFPAG